MDSRTSVIFELLLANRGVFVEAPQETRKAVYNVLHSISFQRALDPMDLEKIKAFARCDGHARCPDILRAIEDLERGFRI